MCYEKLSSIIETYKDAMLSKEKLIIYKDLLSVYQVSQTL